MISFIRCNRPVLGREKQMVESIYYYMIKKQLTKFCASTSSVFKIKFDLSKCSDRYSIYEFVNLAKSQKLAGLYYGSLSDEQLDSMTNRLKEFV